MDSENLVVFAAIALISVGAVVAYFFSPARRLKRRLDRTPVVPIANLEPGAVVRVVGEVALVDDGLKSPVYQQACAYFTVDVRVREYSNAHRGQSWYVARTLERRCDFGVRDASGVVHVDSRGARFFVETASLVLGDRGETEPPPHLVEFLRAYGHPLTNKQGRPRTFGFDEGVVAASARVDVLGTVERRPDGKRVLGGAHLVVRSAEL